jgi:alanyl-tRNA synthetase
MRVSGKHNDLDTVGPSHRHHTFFEMLGNFSFGDYFKKEALGYAWGLLTDVWKMDPNRLVVSIFKGENGIPRDDEAYEVWRSLGIPSDRILELGTDDNFWQMGDTGPCGRCSEIYYVRGGSGHDPEIEIWNNVFMEFERTPDGVLKPLPAPSIDTGMGFERITAVLQNKQSNYDTDIFTPLLAEIGALSGHAYGGAMDPADVSMRVVADHIRSTTFLIADGVIPSNEFRGYVLRKIMRRAMRHGKHLGFTEPFLHRFVAVVDREMGHAYPEIHQNRETIERTILAEEHRFEAVLTEGLPRLETELAKVSDTKSKVLSGDVAFRLYDTFGVPYEFIEDTAATQGITVDKTGFDSAMKAQRDRARAGSAFDQKRTQEFTFASDDARIASLGAGDQFEGYSRTTVQGVAIVSMFDAERRQADSLAEGQSGFVVLERTPFYLESGGQVSDSGTIVNEATAASATVEGIARVAPGGPRAHRVTVRRGSFKPRDIVTAAVDDAVRDATRRNHTATHLLHAALRQTLGSHVKQAGSLVAPDRLRFDFVHFAALTRDELDRIEQIVNEQIYKNTPVTTEIQSTEAAIAAGAMALFGEKYGESVRVVSIPGFSMELCGGTHVRATGDIGPFVITQEGGVSAGVRRIEALTGAGAVQWQQAQRTALERIVGALSSTPDHSVEAIQRLQADAKRLAREVEQLKLKAALGGRSGGEQQDDVRQVKDVRVIARRVAGLEKGALRGLSDSLRDRLGSGIVVIASENDGKVALVASVSKDLVERIQAGQIVKELAPIVGGRGGGRADFAEAGGKDPSRLDDLVADVPRVVETLIG